jgi:hypothetical protein
MLHASTKLNNLQNFQLHKFHGLSKFFVTLATLSETVESLLLLNNKQPCMKHHHNTVIFYRQK